MADLNTYLSRLLYSRLPAISGTGSASGVLTVSTTSYTTAGTSEEDAWTYSLPANTLDVNGRTLRITAFGNYAGTANSKTIKLYFGSTLVINNASSSNGTAWRATATVTRTGASAELYDQQLFSGSSIVSAANGTSATDTTGAITIKIALITATAAADATFKGVIVELLN